MSDYTLALLFFTVSGSILTIVGSINAFYFRGIGKDFDGINKSLSEINIQLAELINELGHNIVKTKENSILIEDLKFRMHKAEGSQKTILNFIDTTLKRLDELSR